MTDALPPPGVDQPIGQAPTPVVQVQIPFQIAPCNVNIQKLGPVPGHGDLIFVVVSTPAATIGTFWTPDALRGLANQMLEAASGIAVAQDLGSVRPLRPDGNGRRP